LIMCVIRHFCSSQTRPAPNYPCTAPAPAPPLPLPLHRPAVAGSMSVSGSAHLNNRRPPDYASAFWCADARLNSLYKRSLECRSICVELQAKVVRLEKVVVKLLKKQEKQTEKKKDKKHAKKARKINKKRAVAQ